MESNGIFKGSFADFPEDLLAQIKYLEDIFTVDKVKLKEVTDHFVKELDKGAVSSSSHQWQRSF